MIDEPTEPSNGDTLQHSSSDTASDAEIIELLRYALSLRAEINRDGVQWAEVTLHTAAPVRAWLVIGDIASNGQRQISHLTRYIERGRRGEWHAGPDRHRL